MNKGYYFETTTEMTEPELRLALEKAGIKTIDARRTTLNNDGIIMTETLAKGIWNHETGFNVATKPAKTKRRSIPSGTSSAPSNAIRFPNDWPISWKTAV